MGFRTLLVVCLFATIWALDAPVENSTSTDDFRFDDDGDISDELIAIEIAPVEIVPVKIVQTLLVNTTHENRTGHVDSVEEHAEPEPEPTGAEHDGNRHRRSFPHRHDYWDRPFFHGGHVGGHHGVYHGHRFGRSVDAEDDLSEDEEAPKNFYPDDKVVIDSEDDSFGKSNNKDQVFFPLKVKEQILTDLEDMKPKPFGNKKPFGDKFSEFDKPKPFGDKPFEFDKKKPKPFGDKPFDKKKPKPSEWERPDSSFYVSNYQDNSQPPNPVYKPTDYQTSYSGTYVPTTYPQTPGKKLARPTPSPDIPPYGPLGQVHLFKPEKEACLNRPIHERFGGQNYYYSWRDEKFNRLLRWVEGRNFCRRMCMDLVALETPSKNQFVKARISEAHKYGLVNGTWTSGRICDFKGCDKKKLERKNSFFWASISEYIPPKGKGFTDWGAVGSRGPQPDNYRAPEDCVALIPPEVKGEPSKQYTWYDVPCVYEYDIVCEDSDALLRYARRKFKIVV